MGACFRTYLNIIIYFWGQIVQFCTVANKFVAKIKKACFCIIVYDYIKRQPIPLLNYASKKMTKD